MDNIKILFEDEDILAIDKPSGLTVNKSDTTREEQTLQDWVEEKFNLQNSTYQLDERNHGEFETPEEAFIKRSGIVHRLDKETSGVILIAKNLESFKNLQKQFKEREIKKTYLALVHGDLIPKTGEINIPVGRLPYNRKRFGIVAGGRESSTQYEVIANYVLEKEKLSFVKLFPKTGRTHQIRVHMKYLNHSIFADELYGGRKTARNDRKYLPRLFLHASKIVFTHPKTQIEMTIECSLSESLKNFLDSLERFI